MSSAEGGDAESDWPEGRLATLREQLDEIDGRLVGVIEERFRVTREVGRLKADVGLPPLDMGREQRILERLDSAAQRSGVDPDLLRGIYRQIFDAVVAEHRRVEREAGG